MRQLRDRRKEEEGAKAKEGTSTLVMIPWQLLPLNDDEDEDLPRLLLLPITYCLLALFDK